jgi:hypothetical protein
VQQYGTTNRIACCTDRATSHDARSHATRRRMPLAQVGSGKSTLLLGMLREIGIANGTVAPPHGAVGYAAQIAYIRNESVRSNILFDSPFDQARYAVAAAPGGSRAFDVC